MDAIVESDKTPVLCEILSAAKSPKYDSLEKKTRNIAKGDIFLKESGMTANRKAFLKIFDDWPATGLIYKQEPLNKRR